MKTDRELIEEFQRGSDAAFNELVRKYLDLVYGFFQKITSDKMEAEDLAQTVFIKLFKALKKFRFESEFNTYLYSFNFNTANTYFKRNKWRNMLHLDQAPDDGYVETSQEKQWRKEEIWAAVGRLPKKPVSYTHLTLPTILLV